MSRPIITLVAALLALSACGGTSQQSTAPAQGDTGGSAAEVPNVTLLASSDIPVAVAIDQGFYQGVNVNFKQVGEDQETSLFIGGDAVLGSMAPWVVAKFDAQGENIKFLSTAGATNFINGVLVRAEDASKYQTIEDLKGKKLGIPGFGSGTWQAFATIVHQLYGIDAKKSFQTVTADPGAELGLLGTGQIDGALLFSGQTAIGMAESQFKLVFSFSKAWQQETGQPMIVDGLVAKGQWADQHPDLVQRVVQGTEKAVQWMRQHPAEFRADGRYADLARQEGWLSDPKASEQILSLLEDGKWFLSKDQYNKAWIDAMYKFVQASKGVLIKGSVPPSDEIFYQPTG